MNFVDLHIMQDPLWNHVLKEEPDFEAVIAPIWRDRKAAMSLSELVNLYRLAKQALRVEGHYAEAGVYQGGSARLLAMVLQGQRELHLFDTFAGLPEVTPGIDMLQVGEIACNLKAVEEYLAGFSNIHFHVGMFPKTTNELRSDARFAFANLDMDTYVSTLEGLKYFYPRMNPGGVILVHDYQSANCAGVKKAVDEFFANRPDPLIELWHSQVACIKMKEN